MAHDWHEPAFEGAVRTWLAARLVERRLELTGLRLYLAGGPWGSWDDGTV